jgi:tetratricopeptide (TPR) repeat protein
VALDPDLPEARTALAYVLGFFDWGWAASERELGRAIELDPYHVLAYVRRANLLAALGRAEEAIADMEKAFRLEPMSFLVHYNRGLVYYWVGRYDDAVRFLRHTLAMDSARADVQRELAHALYGRGDTAEAADLYRSVGDTLFATLATGTPQQLATALRRARSDPAAMPAVARAAFATRLGDHDLALDALAECVRARCRWAPYHFRFPALAPLDDHPRFRQLRREMRLEGDAGEANPDQSPPDAARGPGPAARPG